MLRSVRDRELGDMPLNILKPNVKCLYNQYLLTMNWM